tara:strand:+ start:372 stop:569 length:198 start_codon:yes stop_codon:yes gene_type:complete
MGSKWWTVCDFCGLKMKGYTKERYIKHIGKKVEYIVYDHPDPAMEHIRSFNSTLRKIKCRNRRKR